MHHCLFGSPLSGLFALFIIQHQSSTKTYLRSGYQNLETKRFGNKDDVLESPRTSRGDRPQQRRARSASPGKFQQAYLKRVSSNSGLSGEGVDEKDGKKEKEKSGTSGSSGRKTVKKRFSFKSKSKTKDL